MTYVAKLLVYMHIYALKKLTFFANTPLVKLNKSSMYSASESILPILQIETSMHGERI